MGNKTFVTIKRERYSDCLHCDLADAAAAHFASGSQPVKTTKLFRAIALLAGSVAASAPNAVTRRYIQQQLIYHVDLVIDAVLKGTEVHAIELPPLSTFNGEEDDGD